MPIIMLAQSRGASQSCRQFNRPSGVKQMTNCEEIENAGRSPLPRLVKLLLFVVMQGIAAILVGFAALFLSFEPVWSAEGPGEIRSGALLLKTDGEASSEAIRLGIDVDLTVSGPTV